MMPARRVSPRRLLPALVQKLALPWRRLLVLVAKAARSVVHPTWVVLLVSPSLVPAAPSEVSLSAFRG
jgi:hypothetical protein